MEAWDNPWTVITREVHETTDTDIENTQDFHPVDTDHFEHLQHNNPTKLTSHQGSR